MSHDYSKIENLYLVNLCVGYIINSLYDWNDKILFLKEDFKI